MPEPQDFEALDPAFERILLERMTMPAFSRLLGMQPEEIRRDYCRMSMPYRPEHDQPMGVVHGGALASLIDSVVVGAIFSAHQDIPSRLATIDLHVHYLAPVVKEAVVAEAWVRRRGRQIVFLAAEVRTASGTVAAHGELSYYVVP